MQNLFISHFSISLLTRLRHLGNMPTRVYVIFADQQVVFPCMSIHGCNGTGNLAARVLDVC